MKLVTLLALMFSAEAQDTPVRNKVPYVKKDYDLELNCGECIAAGYNFCWKTEETGLSVNDDEYPTNTRLYSTTDLMCCEGGSEFYEDYFASNGPPPDDGTPINTCTNLLKAARGRSKTEWRCSDTFSSNIYAQYMCPFRRSACGPN